MRLFALYREIAGTSTLELDVPAGATVSKVVEELVARHPRITYHPSSLVVAVNQEYVDHGFLLKEGDEVAFIPPVSGGDDV